MKKFIKISVIVLVILVALYHVAGFIPMKIFHHNRLRNLDLNGETIVITETEYVGYLEEIFTYPDKYLGKEIVIEGFYDCVEYEENEYIHYVYRVLESEVEHIHNDECEEEHDDNIGFEFFTDDELPEIGSFIQVKGTLGTIIEDEEEYLVLENSTVRTDIPEGVKIVK